MKVVSFSLATLLALGTSAGLVGCSEQKPGAQAPAKVGDKTPPGGDSHDHPDKGPHGGALIELGNEQYHAELIHDEKAGTVTIHILDGGAKKPVPIDATELTINLKHDGNAEQFKLSAQPDEADPKGKSSRFTSSDKELAEDLDHEGNEAQLVVEIAGEQFRGKIAHDHDEAGHKHDKK